MATPGNPASFALVRNESNALRTPSTPPNALCKFVRREEDQERLAAQLKVRWLPEQFDPPLAAGVPILRPDAITRMVRHQQAELQSLAVGGLQIQSEGVVERLVLFLPSG